MAPTAREKSPLSEAVAATLIAERAAAGLSREAVRDMTGMPLSTLRRLESGERAATLSQLVQLAPAYGLGVSELIALAEKRMARMARPRQVPVDAEAASLSVDAEATERLRHEQVTTE